MAARRRLENGAWGEFLEVKNLPAPVTAAGIDVAPWLSYDGESLLVTSDRNMAVLEFPLAGDLCAILGDPSACPTVCPVECSPSRPGPFVRGECNGDGRLDLSDAVCALGWLFLGGVAPGCLAAIDANADGEVNISDPVFLLAHLFLDSSPPPEPFPACGCGATDTDGEFGCATPTCAMAP